jgi:SAM-dependent methyltransferase
MASSLSSRCVSEMNSKDRNSKILFHLRKLIRRPDCVLSYDRDLIDTLPDILREQYQISSDADISKNADLEAIFGLIPKSPATGNHGIAGLPSFLRASGVPLDEFVTSAPEGLAIQNPGDFDKWTTAASQKGDKHEEILNLQKDLAMGQWNAQMSRYAARLQIPLKDYLASVTTPPPTWLERIFRKRFWEIKFALWKMTGKLDPEKPSLSIGPRWITEILYFREVVGLREHIGLDLFSDDAELVTAGDMHDIPFPDKKFGFVFLKNTADKSYNVRKLIDEIVRVTAPNAIVVIDQICGYGRNSPLSRTDIQSAHNLLKLFQARAGVRPLVCYDIDVSGLGDARENNEKRNNARLAVQILRHSY